MLTESQHTHIHPLSRRLDTTSSPHTHSQEHKASPPSVDEPCVLSRADIFQDESFLTGGHVNVGQVGFAHIQPVRSVLTGGQLKNIRHQCCHTQAEDVDACEKQAFASENTTAEEHLLTIQKIQDSKSFIVLFHVKHE